MQETKMIYEELINEIRSDIGYSCYASEWVLFSEELKKQLISNFTFENKIRYISFLRSQFKMNYETIGEYTVMNGAELVFPENQSKIDFYGTIDPSLSVVNYADDMYDELYSIKSPYEFIDKAVQLAKERFVSGII